MPYDQLTGLPELNGVTIIGERSVEDYGMIPLSSDDVDSLFMEVFGYVL